ncbi:MAG: cadherin-like domain-containing protein, partial [Betaproteobacteria bacterium]
FTPAANANGTGYASFSFQVQDDGGTANGGVDLDSTPNTLTFDVTAVNDAPGITAPASRSGRHDTPIIFGPSQAITIADPDAGDGAVRVTLSTNRDGALTLGTMDDLSFSIGDGTLDEIMRFTGTLDAVNAALQGLRLHPGEGFTGEMALNIAVDDQGNSGTGDAKTARSEVHVTIVDNAAPVIAIDEPDGSFTENAQDASIVAGGLSLTDADDSALRGAIVRISANYQAGEDTLEYTSLPAGLTAQWNGLTGVLTLSGEAPVADYQAALRAVRYRNSSESPDTSRRVISFTVRDGFGYGELARVGMKVVAVNDPPVLQVSSMTVREGASVTITPLNLHATDVDGDPSTLTFAVTTTPRHGDLLLEGRVLGTGDTFKQADIDAGRLSYAHDGSEQDTDTFRFRLSDGTHTSQESVFRVWVTPVNDPMVLTSAALELGVFEATPLSGSTLHLGLSDPDGFAGLLTFTVQNVTGGRFERTSAPGQAVTSFTAEDIVNRSIRFLAPFGAGTPGFEVAASDNDHTTPFIAATVTVPPLTEAMAVVIEKKHQSEFTPPPQPEPPTPVLSRIARAVESIQTQDANQASAPGETLLTMAVPRTPLARVVATAKSTSNEDKAEGGKKNSGDGGASAASEAGASAQAGPVGSDGARATGTTASVPGIAGIVAPSTAGTAAANAAAVATANATMVALPGGTVGTGTSLARSGDATSTGTNVAADATPLKVDPVALKAHREVLANETWIEQLEQKKEQAAEETQIEQIVVGSSTAVASSLSIGYLAWLVRGGVLLSSLMASLPAWRLIDPLPILGRSGDEDEGGDGDGDGPEDPLERLFVRAQSALGRSRASGPDTGSQRENG